MPCVRFQRTALHLAIAGVGYAEKQFLHDDHKNQNTQSEEGRNRPIRCAVDDLTQAVDGNHRTSRQQNQGPADASKGFHFSMTIRVVGIRRTLGILEGQPDER